MRVNRKKLSSSDHSGGSLDPSWMDPIMENAIRFPIASLVRSLRYILYTQKRALKGGGGEAAILNPSILCLLMPKLFSRKWFITFSNYIHFLIWKSLLRSSKVVHLKCCLMTLFVIFMFLTKICFAISNLSRKIIFLLRYQCAGYWVGKEDMISVFSVLF